MYLYNYELPSNLVVPTVIKFILLEVLRYSNTYSVISKKLTIIIRKHTQCPLIKSSRIYYSFNMQNFKDLV